MWNARKGLVALAVLVVLVVATVVAWPFFHTLERTPGCTVTAAAGATSSVAVTFPLSGEQAQNAATIAAIGMRLGMPDHAVTVALATALQESALRNVPVGDRDSAGLFQQRPSQGWGTREQVLDPIYASTAFYQHLRALPEWTQLMAISAPSADLVSTALAELSTAVLSGAHPIARGWSITSWIVAPASGLAVDRVTFDGRTWTMDSGTWSQTGPADGVLSLHQARSAA